jgi:hypothetical protein
MLQFVNPGRPGLTNFVQWEMQQRDYKSKDAQVGKVKFVNAVSD